jgi:cytochrome c-type biogenesis protein CcmE
VGSSPARLVIALSVAAALAIFVVYTALAGNGIAQLRPSTLAGAKGSVSLVGKVVGRPRGDQFSRAGLRFHLKDIGHASAARVLVVYHGSLPDLFKTGRDVVVQGKLRNGVFVAERGSMSTKCPDHYAPAKSTPKT